MCNHAPGCNLYQAVERPITALSVSIVFIMQRNWRVRHVSMQIEYAWFDWFSFKIPGRNETNLCLQGTGGIFAHQFRPGAAWIVGCVIFHGHPDLYRKRILHNIGSSPPLLPMMPTLEQPSTCWNHHQIDGPHNHSRQRKVDSIQFSDPLFLDHFGSFVKDLRLALQIL
jgi:hypothetical protein